MKKLEKSESERIALIATISALPLLIGGIVYVIHLRSINAIKSDVEFVLFSFCILLFSTIICFVFYELLYSLKVKGKRLFHLKRFFTHTFAFIVYWASIIVLWSALQFLSIPWKYGILIASLTSSLVLALMVNIPKIKNFLKKIEEGE